LEIVLENHSLHEYLLEVYHGPYDPDIPVIRMDESHIACGYMVMTKPLSVPLATSKELPMSKACFFFFHLLY
jgi:hypothetical protein